MPKGFYALPVHDWGKFSDDCWGPGDETPPLDLLGFRLFARHVPTVIKTGQRAGQTIGRDLFIPGQRVLARGVQPRIVNRRNTVDGPVYQVRYTPSERLKREAEGDRWAAEHDSRPEGDTSPLCRCAYCNGADREWCLKTWKPAPDQANAYRNEVAGALIHAIKNENDIHRKLYGLLTGRCGRCGRLLTDPESKRLGLGPDCRGYR